MKKCPFCAEEIQDAAIKCRFCGEFLSTAKAADTPESAADPADEAPAQAAAPAPAQAAAPAPAPAPAHEATPPFAHSTEAGSSPRRRERKILYAGCPSWRAFFKEYFLVLLATIIAPVVTYWMGGVFKAGVFTKFLLVSIPLAMGAIAFMSVTFYRRSKVVRVTTTNIETEHGILAKKIDVLELWRCRDVRYKQSLFDRILHIAHIEIFTADVTTPQLEIVGLPASRQLFESIRDSIEIQRQSRNVYGVIS